MHDGALVNVWRSPLGTRAGVLAAVDNGCASKASGTERARDTQSNQSHLRRLVAAFAHPMGHGESEEHRVGPPPEVQRVPLLLLLLLPLLLLLLLLLLIMMMMMPLLLAPLVALFPLLVLRLFRVLRWSGRPPRR